MADSTYCFERGDLPLLVSFAFDEARAAAVRPVLRRVVETILESGARVAAG